MADVRKRFREAIDVRAGLIGATLIASIVWWINADDGAAGATTAAAKQWVYTFFMGGFVVQFSAGLAVRPGPRALRLALAIVLPTLVTVAATFLLHSLRGTPRPMASTVPVALISPPSFAAWAIRARRLAAQSDAPLPG